MAFGLVAAALPTVAPAESQFVIEDDQSPARCAHLDFAIVIPAYVYLGFGKAMQADDSAAYGRIVGNGGTLALSVPLPAVLQAQAHGLVATSGTITEYTANLPIHAEVNSRNATVIYSVSLP